MKQGSSVFLILLTLPLVAGTVWAVGQNPAPLPPLANGGTPLKLAPTITTPSTASVKVATAAGTTTATTAATPPATPAIRVLVAAAQESILAAQMAGRIDQIGVHLGSHIKTGQALLRFVCEEQDAHLKMAKAEFYGAQQTYESRLKLQAMQSGSQLEVEQAASNAERLKAQIQLHQAQLKLCQISAPFSGRVTKLHVKPFESVNVGQPLIEIVNSKKLKAQLHVPSIWLSWLKTGTPFAMQIEETGKKYEARVARINGKVDPVSQSIEIEADVVGETEDLLPGMSGLANFPDAGKTPVRSK
jgi:RND family efflux transporter MFP subunit